MPKSALRRQEQEGLEHDSTQPGQSTSTTAPRMEPPPPYDAPYRDQINSRNNSESSNNHKENDGGCMNQGHASGCMNVNTRGPEFKVDGCMNYNSPSGCLNYESGDGCLNYKSNDGCLNYQSEGGCLNYKSGVSRFLRI